MPKSSFGKVAAILAVSLLIGIGLCGLSRVLPSGDDEFHTNIAGGISIVIMFLSFVGLIVTLIAWAIAGILRRDP